MKKMLDSVNSGVLTRQKIILPWIIRKPLFLVVSLFSFSSFENSVNFFLNIGKLAIHEGLETELMG